MLIVALLILFWTSMVRMYELHVQYPPCFFNPLCTCSKGIPDLGIVSCYNVPMLRIPQFINVSKVFTLHLENNGLRTFQAQFLINTGLYKLQIKRNLLADVPDEAFLGLERSLWELELPYNHLVNVPSRAFRHLQKLRLLDLTGNQISSITPDNWRGLENSLQILRLGKNSIDKLPVGVFASLTYLQLLDLHGNNIKEMDASVFKDGMGHITQLYLNDNQLTNIPYSQLSLLKSMKVLDLSYNRISKMLQPQFEMEMQGLQISLDVLRLDYNQIHSLTLGSFQHFYKVNKTYLDGNPLEVIEKGAFRDSRIRELYLSDCNLFEISSDDFFGLEFSLELLDLSANNFTKLPDRVFEEFDFLRTLILRENRISIFNQEELFDGFQYSLYNLDLSGKRISTLNLQNLRRMRNLRFFATSQVSQSILSPDDFLEFSMDIKEFQIVQSNLNTIKGHAFMYIRGIKHLDLSENSIAKIDNEAFFEVGHSLLTLKISHGFATSVTILPSEALKSLTNLQHLDFSNNKIQSISDTSFHFLKRIKRIDLQDNEIQNILKGTFQGDIHSSLEEINLAFNHVKYLQSHTFTDLSSLISIYLEDNVIDRIERKAFMNMNRLKYINLRGNNIRDIVEEAFQNLPDLEFLDLAYNDLDKFNFASFDQVGTLSFFKVNVSHNNILKLWINSTMFVPTNIGGTVQSNIKVLDLSYNNISDIMMYYFKPVEYSLTHLYLKYNKLNNVTQGTFGNMPHLQWLDLSHNYLTEMDFDCFRNTRNLQILFLSWNNIMDIPVESFRPLKKLRVIDLSHNKLRSLPENLFLDASIESLDLSHNQFMQLPIKSMSLSTAAILSTLDMSWNTLVGVHDTDALFRLRSIVWLDLSYNRLIRLDEGIFSDLPYLAHLDLSHNKQLILEPHGKTFIGLEDTLLTLGLSNISLLSVPELTLRRLRTFYLAHNELPTIPTEVSSNLTSLHYLDLSHNDLTVVPLITHTLPELKILKLHNNPIATITNTSFLGLVDSLQELDIRRLSLSTFEAGALCKASKLHTLLITAYTGIKNFNFPNLLEYNCGLRNLFIDIQNETALYKETRGKFPVKLRNITLSGKALRWIYKDAFQGIRNPHFHIALYNTSVNRMPRELFINTRWIRNVTIDLHESDIRSIGNPSSAHKPGLPGKRFLTKLKTAGSHLTCDCDIGWIEMWQRKQRQYQEGRCGTYGDYNYEYDDDEFNCWDNGWNDDLRETFCLNKNNISLLQTLKTDIECGWSSATSLYLQNNFIILFFTMILANVC